jgi:hypothetical protein
VRKPHSLRYKKKKKRKKKKKKKRAATQKSQQGTVEETEISHHAQICQCRHSRTCSTAAALCFDYAAAHPTISFSPPPSISNGGVSTTSPSPQRNADRCSLLFAESPSPFFFPFPPLYCGLCGCAGLALLTSLNKVRRGGAATEADTAIAAAEIGVRVSTHLTDGVGGTKEGDATAAVVMVP